MPLRSMIHSFRVHDSEQTRQEQGEVPFFAPNVNQGLPTLSGKTLVVPVVSAANVPQLAVDVLIASLKLSRLGAFDSKFLVPVVGAREGGEHGVTTPLELFGREDLDFVVIQQRSPVLKSCKDKFISSLLNFVQVSKFACLLFLSGVDPTNRSDSQMSPDLSTPIYYLLPAASPSLDDSSLETLTFLPRYTPVEADDKIPSMPGGGLTRRLLSSIPNGWPAKTGALAMFALEGDNRTDANFMAGIVSKLLRVEERIHEWKEPESWRQGLFGTPNDQSLFG